MSVAMSNGVVVGTPRMLFQATDAIDFEPSADGGRFLTQVEQHTAEPSVNLLINWPARLGAESSYPH